MSNKDDVVKEQQDVQIVVQRAVDRNIAARAELDASNKELEEVREALVGGDAATLAYLDQYRNPSLPNPPAPLVPDVAAPPPAEEPPVFTSVDSTTLDTATTSGGSAETIADNFEQVAPTPDAPVEG